MLPILSVPSTVSETLSDFRSVFCRDEGFDYINRYITGLLVNPNKTLQGIFDLQVWVDREKAPSRRSMHESIFETNWSSDTFIQTHRRKLGLVYRGRGRYVISLDWTLSHHDRGPKIYAVKKRYDYVEKRYCLHQILPTAVISNKERIDGLDVIVQEPTFEKEEKVYLDATTKETYESLEDAGNRFVELLTYLEHQKAYRKKSEIFPELVQQIEDEGNFPFASYVFDNGVLCLELAQEIESRNKYWLSELEVSRHIFWNNRYRRIDEVARELRQEHPESFRKVTVQKRNGKLETYWVFTKCVRLRRYGKKRIYIIHRTEDLSDTPSLPNTSP